MRDLYTLPDDLPVPLDDGSANHVVGAKIPDITLRSTDGTEQHLVDLTTEPTVLFFYPRTGVPGREPLRGYHGEIWEDIPGARGCTPQNCGFRDVYAEFMALGVNVFGVSTQSTEFQREFKTRNHIPFDYLSDCDLRLVSALRLPMFEFPVETGGPSTLIKRMSWFVFRGRIEHVMYPVFPPNENASRMLNWLQEHVRYFDGISYNGLVYRRESMIDVEEVAHLFASSGIRRPHDNLERLSRMLRYANLTITARQERMVVLNARAYQEQRMTG